MRSLTPAIFLHTVHLKLKPSHTNYAAAVASAEGHLYTTRSQRSSMYFVSLHPPHAAVGTAIFVLLAY